jgi:transposase
MRYELSDYEWAAIKPFLPNKPRGIPRVKRSACAQRYVLGLAIRRAMARSARDLWALYDLLQSLRSLGTGWCLGPDHGALAAMHDAAVQMIDTSVVQHGGCIAGNGEQHMGRSRGGLTTKMHAVVDTNGLPVQIGLTPARCTTISFARFS